MYAVGQRPAPAPEVERYAPATLAGLVPTPARDANKYSRGKLVAVVGSARYPGAAVLSSVAASRMGAGYTEVYSDDAARPALVAAAPSLVVRPLDALDPALLPQSRPGKPCAVLMGCGFDGADVSVPRVVGEVLMHAACPVVVDGGALAALAGEEAFDVLAARQKAGRATVLTPHGGEAARLVEALGAEAHAAWRVADAPRQAVAIARIAHATVLLKGPVSHVSDGERVAVMDEGGPALSKAGTGDVLAGMVGALLAQGLHAFDACMLAATLHARAAAAAVERLTEVCVCAEDLPRFFPEALRSL